jgi:alginate O-acetyltransferase complex protein AlgI
MTFLLVCVGWVLFRAQTFTDAMTIVRGMVVPTRGSELAGDGRLLVMICLTVTLVGQALGQLKGSPRALFRVPVPVAGAAMAAALTLALVLTPGEGKAFIYFQF